MSKDATFVVVGGGQAGGRAVEAMRNAGFDGRVVLVAEEDWTPYERPPLSKKLLLGEVEAETTYVNPADYYAEHAIEVIAGTRAVALDPEARRIELSKGDAIAYDKVLLVTGGRVRTLDIPGAELKGVHYIRTLDDSLGLRQDLADAGAVVVIGGGYLGLEVAASARTLGLEATVLEREPAVLDRVAAPEIGRLIENMHSRRGTAVHTGVEVAAIEGDGRVTGVRLADGTKLKADVVVVSVGIVPNVELAEEAGAAIDDGIAANEYGETSVEGLYAAGDVASFPNGFAGRRVRLESWQNAQNQAIATVRTMCGERVPYNEVPWFWSDQYDFNIQLAGVPDHWDDIVMRGEPTGDRFSAFYMLEDRIVGVMAFNNGLDVRVGQGFMEAGLAVDRAVLADPEVKLRALLKEMTSNAA